MSLTIVTNNKSLQNYTNNQKQNFGKTQRFSTEGSRFIDGMIFKTSLLQQT